MIVFLLGFIFTGWFAPHFQADGPAEEVAILGGGFVKFPTRVPPGPVGSVLQQSVVGDQALDLSASVAVIPGWGHHGIADTPAAVIAVFALGMLHHVIGQGFQAALVQLQSVRVGTAQTDTLAVPAAFDFVTGEPAAQQYMKMRHNGFLICVGVGFLPLHYGQAFRLVQPGGFAFLPDMPHEIAEIPPGFFRGGRALVGGVGQGGVGVFSGKVGDGQTVKPSPGRFGVVGRLGGRRPAESGRRAVLSVQIPAEAVPGGERVDLHFLVLRLPGVSAAQVSALSLVGLHEFLAFLV